MKKVPDHSSRSRFFSVLFCLVALFSHYALPVVHALHVAREEAGHPLQTFRSPDSFPVLKAEETPTHSHHDPASCSVCPTVSKSKKTALLNAAAVFLTRPASSSLPDAAAAVASRLDFADFSPRGPPTA